MKMAALAVLSASLLMGMAQCQADKRTAQLTAELDQLVGSATKERIAGIYGMPRRRETLGSMEYWQYRISYGTVYFRGTSREQYDEFQLGFDAQGILRKWRASVRR